MKALQKADWTRRIIPIIGILIFATLGTFLLRDLFDARDSGRTHNMTHGMTQIQLDL